VPDFTITPQISEMRQRVGAFMDEHIFPNEHVLEKGGADAEGLMRDLQSRAKSMGMWAPHLPAEAGGMGIGFMTYVYVNEITVQSSEGQIAPTVIATRRGDQSESVVDQKC